MERTHFKSEIDSLEKKLDKLKSNKKDNSVKSFKIKNDGWRMVIELVVGMLIGFGIGLGLDIFMNTKPLFLIIFTLLGFIAGVRTMLNTAKTINKESVESSNV